MAGFSITVVVLSALPVILAALLINLPWESSIVHEFGRVYNVTGQDAVVETSQSIRTSVRFPSHGETIHAWLYRPQQSATNSVGKPPVVVMGHGMGVQKDIGLPKFANGFAGAGVAALVIDYRGFGGSDGEPRNLISWRRHLEDYEAAVNFVKATGVDGMVDSSRIALWGSSYAGGHSLVTAAKFGHDISAVVAMEPFLFGNATRARQQAKNTRTQIARMVAAGLSDYLRGKLGMAPSYLPLMRKRGEPGVSMGQLSAEDYDIFMRSIPVEPLGGWTNLAPARLIFDYIGYMPIKHVPYVTCPVLFLAGGADELTPPSLVQQAVSLIPDRSTYLEYEGATHFTLYHAPTIIADTAKFLRKQLRVGGADEATPEE